jgi:hypothetical protein
MPIIRPCIAANFFGAWWVQHQQALTSKKMINSIYDVFLRSIQPYYISLETYGIPDQLFALGSFLWLQRIWPLCYFAIIVKLPYP